MLPLGKDRKGLPQFHRRICYKRATHTATTRQQLFSMIQQSPTNKVKKSVPCCRRSKHQTLLQGYPCWPVKMFLEKPSAMQPHRPGDHGQRPFVPGAPLAPPAPWGGRAGSPAMKLGRSENDVDGYSPSDRFTWQDSPGRPIRFWPFRYSQAAGSSPVSPSMPSPRPRDFADVAWMHRFKQDYTYFAGY